MVKGRVLFVDDQLFLLEAFIFELKAAGYDVDSTSSIKDAHTKLSANRYDLVVLDVMMPMEDDLPFLEDATIMNVGLHFAAEIRKHHEDIRIIIFSQGNLQHAPFIRDRKVLVVGKSSSLPLEFIEAVDHMMADKKPSPKIYIVHGRDRSTLLELKNCLQNTLLLSEPGILAEQKSGGETIIEKFERHANRINAAFVLMTPDDVGSLAGSEPETAYRARQNVVFELGYFMGKLGRKSGRVIVLHKGRLEIASDLAGLIYIDVSNGINAAGEDIRRELRGLW
jgi:predicted nucleotide-binding protein